MAAICFDCVEAADEILESRVDAPEDGAGFVAPD